MGSANFAKEMIREGLQFLKVTFMCAAGVAGPVAGAVAYVGVPGVTAALTAVGAIPAASATQRAGTAALYVVAQAEWGMIGSGIGACATGQWWMGLGLIGGGIMKPLKDWYQGRGTATT